MYVYGACLFFMSNCVQVCGNVCCVAAFVKNRSRMQEATIWKRHTPGLVS